MIPKDTHPIIFRRHLELLRQAGTERRLQLALSLTQSALELSRRAVEVAHLTLDAKERQLRFIELCYGSELATRVRSQLGRRPV